MKLTTREVEVISLIAEGKDCKEIGEQLEMTKQSLEIYKKNLLRKSKTSNLPHLVSWFYTRYFPNQGVSEEKYNELQRKYNSLRLAMETNTPVAKPRVEQQIHETPEGVKCQGCVVKDAKIKRLQDELWGHKRHNVGNW